MAIDFKQVAAPSFSDANELFKTGITQSNDAFKELNSTWDAAGAAVQNTNHAQILEMVNGQTREQLQDPTSMAALQGRIKELVKPSGNVYDPLVIQAAIDGRQDTLVNREVSESNRVQEQLATQDAFSNTQELTRSRTAEQETRNLGDAASISDYIDGDIQKIGTMPEYTAKDTEGNLVLNEKGQQLVNGLIQQKNDALSNIFKDGIDLRTGALLNETEEGRTMAKRLADIGITEKLTNIDATNQNIKASENNIFLNTVAADQTQQKINEAVRVNSSNIGLGERAQTLNEDKVVIQAEQFNRTEATKLQQMQTKGATAAQIAKAKSFGVDNLPVDSLNTDGTFNGKSVSDSLVAKLGAMQNELSDPSNVEPFNAYAASKKMPTTDHLPAFQKAVNKYEAKGFHLNDNMRKELLDAFVVGGFGEPGILGAFGGGGTFSISEKSRLGKQVEAAIPKYVAWHENVKIPAQIEANTQKEILRTLDVLQTKHSVNSTLAAKQMGITPGTVYFPMLPQNVRNEMNAEAAKANKPKDNRVFQPRVLGFDPAMDYSSAKAKKEFSAAARWQQGGIPYTSGSGKKSRPMTKVEIDTMLKKQVANTKSSTPPASKGKKNNIMTPSSKSYTQSRAEIEAKRERDRKAGKYNK